MEKFMKDDIYVIEGIESSAELASFYDEVVEKNIEKYIGITSQGRKFKYDSARKKAILLLEDEQYGINPNYRKIETMEEMEQSVADTSPTATVEYSIEETTKVSEGEITIPVEFKDEQPEQVAEPEIDAKDIEIAQLKENLKIVEQEKALAMERAEVAEKEWAIIGTKNKELTDTIVQYELKFESLNSPQATANELDRLVEQIKQLGYEVFLRKM